MASIVMYEIMTSIRLHPLLLTAAGISRLSDGEAREIDARIAGGFRIQQREASCMNELLLIAGKDEGFIDHMYIRTLPREIDVEAQINALRNVGYCVFNVYKQTVRVDDIVGVVERFKEGE